MDEALGGAKKRAWMVGIGLGVLAGILAAGTGMMAGMCCLFQFGNAIIPGVTGLIAGGLAAGLAPWASLPGATAIGTGAGLGARGGGIAAAVSGLVGFLLTLAYPIVSTVLFPLLSLTSGGEAADVVTMIIAGLVGLAWSAFLAAMFAFGGTLVGLALGAGIGALLGAVMGSKE